MGDGLFILQKSAGIFTWIFRLLEDLSFKIIQENLLIPINKSLHVGTRGRVRRCKHLGLNPNFGGSLGKAVCLFVVLHTHHTSYIRGKNASIIDHDYGKGRVDT